MKDKIARFIKQEAVLCVAIALTAVSMFLVPPDSGYASYISNVSIVLLSGFTEDILSLIIGVNLGGLDTLIASMVSLISYKMVVKESGVAGRYFRFLR